MVNNSFPNSQVSQSLFNGIQPPPNGSEEDLIKRNVQVVTNPNVSFFTHEANKWDFERGLLGFMIENPSAFQNDPASVAFYDQKKNQAVGLLAKAEWMVAGASKLALTEQQQLQNLLAQSNAKSDALAALDHQASQSGAAADQAEKTALLADLALLRSQITALENSVRSVRMTYFENEVRPFVQSIQPALAIESNYKTYLAMQVKSALGETLSEADYNAIRAIADLCRYTDGEVVVGTRMMLPEEESRSYPVEGEEGFCNGQFGKHSAEDRAKAVQISDASLFPNPVDESLKISFDVPFTGFLTIRNAIGKPLYMQSLTGVRSHLVDATAFPVGVCWATMTDENGQKRAFKFIVLH